ncbi:MAG: P27 family phage terminase small subunit [Patescibacteria group bacterium]|nr:P27 family phage terminase small subunit [Patescibacteria group bacterium]
MDDDEIVDAEAIELPKKPRKRAPRRQTVVVAEGLPDLTMHRSMPAAHGARSYKILSTVADEVADEVMETYPWFKETDRVGIEQYCRAEARSRLLWAYIQQIIDTEGPEKVSSHIWEQSTRADAQASRAAEALGFTPLGRTKIIKDASIGKHYQKTSGLEELMQAGRATKGASDG